MLPFLPPPPPSRPSCSSSRLYTSRLPSSSAFSPVVLRSVFEGTPRGEYFRPHNVYRDVKKAGYYGGGLASIYTVARWAFERPTGGIITVMRVLRKPIILIAMPLPAFALTEGLCANIRGKEAKSNTAIAGWVGGLFIAQAARTRHQAAVIPFLFGFVAYLNELMPWAQHRPYGIDRIVARDNDRLMAGESNRRWEDIKPPPGEGYGIWPGADRSYTIGVKVQGAVIDEDFWLPVTGDGEVWPKGGPHVLRPENKEGRMPKPIYYKGVA